MATTRIRTGLDTTAALAMILASGVLIWNALGRPWTGKSPAGQYQPPVPSAPKSPDNYSLEEPSWVAVGWRLHLSRVIHPDSQVAAPTQIEMSGGSRHPVYQIAVNDPWWRSADFFLYNRTPHVLKLPNGLACTFGKLSSAADGGELGAMQYVALGDAYLSRYSTQF